MIDFNYVVQLVLIPGYNFEGGLGIKPKLLISCWIKLLYRRSYRNMLPWRNTLQHKHLIILTQGSIMLTH